MTIIKLAFRRHQVLGIIGIIFSFVLLLLVNISMEFVESYALTHISQDGIVEPESIAKIKFMYLLGILAVCIISFAFYFDLFRKARNLIFIIFDTEKIGDFFLTDDLYQNRKLSLNMIFIGVGSALFLQFYTIAMGEIKREGVIETTVAIIFLITSIILLFSGIRTGNKLLSGKERRISALMLYFFSVIFLFMFLEDISYGQHLLGFETPETIRQINYQNEFNFHNLFNPFFPYLYPLFGMGAFIIFLFIWFFRRNWESRLFYLLFPPRGFFFVLFMMACSSFRGHSETFESLIGITAFLWSIRIFKCLNYLKTEYPLTSK